MAGRPRKATVVLGSIEDCTRAMGELLQATITEEQLVANRDEAVALLQRRYEGEIDAARKQMADLEAGLRTYYYAHLEEVERGGRKSIELATGVMGRRDHPPAVKLLNKQWSWAAVKATVRNKWGLRYYHEPKEPDLDKEKLKELEPEQLKSVGLKLEADETFYVEPARLPAAGGRGRTAP